MESGILLILFLMFSSIFITWFTAIAFYERDYRKLILVLSMVLIISTTFSILYGAYNMFSEVIINCYKTIGCDVGNQPFIKEIIENYEIEQAKDLIQNKLREK